MAYVYRHIRTDKNQPFYIGVGRKDNGYRRAYQSGSYTRSAHWKSIASRGYEVEIILDNLTEEQAFKKEIEFIALYGRSDKGTGILCNHTDGGDRPEPMYGERNPTKRPEVRKKISIRAKEREKRAKDSPRVISEDTRKKLSLAAKRNKSKPPAPVKKPLIQLTTCGDVVRRWDCVSDAASSVSGWNPMNIYQVVSGYKKTAYGYRWEYV